ncbi:MAG: ribonuclease J [Candidatus Pacebacteria bacterium]|nr:ribonuclease J [Candidatus Paceibacterota bacterium]
MNDRRPFHGRPQYGNNSGGQRNNRIDNRPIIAPIGQSASVSTSSSPRTTPINTTNIAPTNTGTTSNSVNHTDALNEFKGLESEQPTTAPKSTTPTSAPKTAGHGNRGIMNRNRPMRRPEPPQKSLINTLTKPAESGHLPLVAPGNIRIIPLGGVEKIGMNMTAIEIGEDIIVIDAGFAFTEESTPGIDYILPNTKYLEERKSRVKAIIITHGHLDHIGGIPYIMDRIGNPPMYTRNLTALMVKKRQSEFPHLEPIDFKIVEQNDRIKIGGISVQFFGITHTIPDCIGIAIETPYGYVVTPGDFKLDHVDEEPTAEEVKSYSFFDDKKVLALLADSTNIENPGFSTPERLVLENLDSIIRDTKGRMIVGMFASHFHRIAKIVESSEKYGKKVLIEGRSMKNNIDIAIQSGMLVVKKGTLIAPQEIDNFPPDKVVVLATGAQGDEFAALMRMASGNYKHFKLSNRDTILLSASIIPGNEKAVDKLKDKIARTGARIIHYRTSEVFIHSTGHANRGELEWLHKKLKPRFFIPIHGTHYKLRQHAELAMQLGMPADHIVVPDNGTIIEIREEGTKLVRMAEKAPDNVVMVDGFTIGDIQDVVIRDRQVLSSDGIFVVIALINASTGKLKKSPDIISRGSVYLRESQDLLRETRHLVKYVVEQNTENMHPINIDYIKDVVSEALSKFIFQHTAKRPIVIPVMICV